VRKPHEKKIELNQKIIRFCLAFPLKKRIFALLSGGKPNGLFHCTTQKRAMHRHNTSTAP